MPAAIRSPTLPNNVVAPAPPVVAIGVGAAVVEDGAEVLLSVAEDVIFKDGLGVLVGVYLTPSEFVQTVSLPVALPVILPAVGLVTET